MESVKKENFSLWYLINFFFIIMLFLMIIFITYLDLLDNSLGFRIFIINMFLVFCIYLIFFLDSQKIIHYLASNTKLVILIVIILFSFLIFLIIKDFFEILFLLAFFPIKFLRSNIFIEIASIITPIEENLLSTFIYWISIIIGYPFTVYYWILVALKFKSIFLKKRKLYEKIEHEFTLVYKEIFREEFIYEHRIILIVFYIFILSILTKIPLILLNNGSIIGYDVTFYMHMTNIENISQINILWRSSLFTILAMIKNFTGINPEHLIIIVLVFVSALIAVEIFIIAIQIKLPIKAAFISSLFFIFSPLQLSSTLDLLSQYFAISVTLIIGILILKFVNKESNFNNPLGFIIYFLLFAIGILSHELTLFFTGILGITYIGYYILKKMHKPTKFIYFTLFFLLIFITEVIIANTKYWILNPDDNIIQSILNFLSLNQATYAIVGNNPLFFGLGSDLSILEDLMSHQEFIVISVIFSFLLIWISIWFGFIGILSIFKEKCISIDRKIFPMLLGIAVLFSTGTLHTWIYDFRMIIYLEIILLIFSGYGFLFFRNLLSKITLKPKFFHKSLKYITFLIIITSTSFTTVNSINHPAVPYELREAGDWVTDSYPQLKNYNLKIYVSNITNPASFGYYLSYKFENHGKTITVVDHISQMAIDIMFLYKYDISGELLSYLSNSNYDKIYTNSKTTVYIKSDYT